MNREATLTVCETTDDVVAYVSDRGCETRAENTIPDGMAMVRDGNRLLRLDVTTLTCVSSHVNGEHLHVTHEGEAWTDSTPGAASHADNTPPADEWCCDHSCDNCSGIGPASCINHRPHHPPADEREPCDQADGFVCTLPHVWVDGQAYHSEEPYSTPPADVCDNPDCENGIVTRAVEGIGSAVPFPCPSCGGTDDRPAVTDTERRIRETVEGKGAMKVMSAEARLIHIARLLDTEYVPTEKIPGWESPAVTDAEVEAASRYLDRWHCPPHRAGSEHLPHFSPQQVRAALEAAAATRQEQ